MQKPVSSYGTFTSNKNRQKYALKIFYGSDLYQNGLDSNIYMTWKLEHMIWFIWHAQGWTGTYRIVRFDPRVSISRIVVVSRLLHHDVYFKLPNLCSIELLSTIYLSEMYVYCIKLYINFWVLNNFLSINYRLRCYYWIIWPKKTR